MLPNKIKISTEDSAALRRYHEDPDFQKAVHELENQINTALAGAANDALEYGVGAVITQDGRIVKADPESIRIVA